eukprot:5344352-Pyramimonas_sp.AAC.1
MLLSLKRWPRFRASLVPNRAPAAALASLFPAPCHGMIFGPSKQTPKSRKWPPEESIGSDCTCGVDAVIFFPERARAQ